MSARILVAEDEPHVREFLVRGLVHAGYSVHAVENGREALEQLAGEDVFDLLLTDIVMPELDGIALALKVARDYPGLRILMMTGYAAEKQRAHNIDALSHEVVSKPFSLAEILQVVARVLSQLPAGSVGNVENAGEAGDATKEVENGTAAL